MVNAVAENEVEHHEMDADVKLNKCSKFDEVFEKSEEKCSQDGKKVIEIEREENKLNKCSENGENFEKSEERCSQDGKKVVEIASSKWNSTQIDERSISDSNDMRKVNKSDEVKNVIDEKCSMNVVSKKRSRTRKDVVVPSTTPNSVTHVTPSVLVELFETVYKSGRPNFRGCRIPLPGNKFNIPLWRELLHDYPDNIVCDFLEFGFPLDFDTSVNLRTDERRNHKGA